MQITIFWAWENIVQSKHPKIQIFAKNYEDFSVGFFLFSFSPSSLKYAESTSLYDKLGIVNTTNGLDDVQWYPIPLKDCQLGHRIGVVLEEGNVVA